jgi:hypothetical protein
MQVVVEVDGGQVEELCQIQIILEEVEELVMDPKQADQEWLIEAAEAAVEVRLLVLAVAEAEAQE